MSRPIVWVPLALLAIIALALLFGPRVEVDTSLQPLELPVDLDTYLEESEAQFEDIVPGTEKTIIWAGETIEFLPAK